jgi:cytidylate kinase
LIKNSVAIDGPAGAGKSTLARAAAGRFGLMYADTGALYRCVGLAALRAGVAPGDAGGVGALLSGLNIGMARGDDDVQRMLIGGEDVTEAIRLPEISAYASDVSALPAVRAFLLDKQKELADKYDVIMDGRDIGTVILPGAGLKVYLTASPEVRARRRYAELSDRGLSVKLEDVKKEMEERDHNDMTRAEAPLRQAEDAILLDTSALTFEEALGELCDLIIGRFLL